VLQLLLRLEEDVLRPHRPGKPESHGQLCPSRAAFYSDALFAPGVCGTAAFPNR
jgi:hypothetical protein